LRAFNPIDRSLAVGSNGMAATSHPLSTLTAIETLKAGGNAMDAAIAAVAVQCVVEPAMTGLGGDCFALFAPRGGLPVALNGSGRAPAAATAEHFAERGITAPAPTSPHAVTVPGCVDAWVKLNADHGTKPLEELLRPAIGIAEEGFRVTPRVAFDWINNTARLEADADARDRFLPGGRVPAEGDLFRMPALAETLRAVARRGRAGFYEGEVADGIVAKLRSLGGLHTAADFDAQRAEAVDPIATRFRGHDVYECPPNGQGLIALMMLRLAEKLDLASATEADRVHLLAEITKAAYLARDTYLADPRQVAVPVEALLSDAWADSILPRIDRRRAQPPVFSDEVPHRDTVCLSVVDRDRNCVSFINSIFNSFGSGIYVPASGILLHNRGLSFRFAPGHANSIAPGKRPLHTIIPGMVCRDGRAVMPFGVMGGQYQATGHVDFLSNVLGRGLDPQDASDTPRTFATEGVLQVEPTLRPDVVEDLRARGHVIAVQTTPIGGCQSVLIDEARGALFGGSDHRKDGIALGY
jgi:gamma-glutamyltranspeptidase/glutathione hydrolase